MINYTENYFDLKLLKLSEIKLHEATENNRLRNIYGRIFSDKYLMNPIIVAKYEDDYVLIDGANRFSSLKEIGCKLALAQIIDYKDKEIRLSHWNHIVYDFSIEILKEHFRANYIKFKNIKYKTGAKRLTENLHHLLITDLVNNETILVYLSEDLGELLNELSELTKTYFHKYDFDRSEAEIDINELKTYSRRKGVLIEYPNFKKKHIVKIARNNLRMPAGITRHILKARVLHIRYELENLIDDNNIEKKTEQLKEYLTEKIDSNKVRQYTESVIVFDE